MRPIYVVIFAAVLSGIWFPRVQAQSLIEDQPLSFGLIGIIPSMSSGTVSVDLAGTTTTSGAIFSATSGQVGTYTATGFTALTAVSLSATMQTALSNAGNPPGATLSLSAFVFPDPAITDSGGQLIFDMGATLTTDGTITDYGSGIYDGTLVITIIIP